MMVTRVLCALAACALALPPLARAQNPTRRWELEGFGGIASAPSVENGRITLPAPGGAIVTSNPIFPARQTSSWFFGDGASLLNAVNAEFGRPSRATPLESVLGPLADPRLGTFGARLRRRLADGSTVEFGVDVLGSTDDGSTQLRAALETVRGSYKAAFDDLFGSGPFTAIAVTTTATMEPAVRRTINLTTALNYRVATWRSFVPYATIGAGVATHTGGLPAARLESHYRFLIDDQIPIDETDRVSLRFSRGASAVFIVGGGVRCDVSSRWGVRVDARMLIGDDTTRVTLDAQPSSVRGTPPGFVESYTTPALQFSNDPATGRQSTLSGGAIQGFALFTGEHQRRGLVTFGLFVKF
jgi:hypothetical protein